MTIESDAKIVGQTAGWNVLVYMAADNNLKEECVYALTEMLNLGPLHGVDLIVQLDTGDAVARYDFRTLREHPEIDVSQNDYTSEQNRSERVQYRGSNGSKPDLDLISDVILSGSEALQNASDLEMLKSFLLNTTENTLKNTRGIPSSNMIVLSGHGSGAVGDFLSTDDPPSSLSIPKLREALEIACQQIGGKIDILGMDSCLMSMVEVCYELRKQVDFLVGAEGFEQNTGWPYHKILRLLKDPEKPSPADLARRIVEEYIVYYSPYYIAGISVDHSVCDLSKVNVMTNLRTAITGLADSLMDNLGREQVKNAVLLAHWRAQSYKFEQYVDLWDFCSLLKDDLQSGIYNIKQLKNVGQLKNIKQSPADWENIITEAKEWEEIREKIEEDCRLVMDAIDEVVLASRYHGASFQHSHGLSIYFPWAKTELEKNLKSYKKLAFARDTRWDEFLQLYVDKTQREVRDDQHQEEKGNKPLSMSPQGLGETRTNPQLETRTNPQLETRTNPQLETKGKLFFIPQVKNPPTQFFKDDLPGKLGKNGNPGEQKNKDHVQG